MTSRGLRLCARCGYQGSVITGAIFQGTRQPLTQWFQEKSFYRLLQQNAAVEPAPYTAVAMGTRGPRSTGHKM